MGKFKVGDRITQPGWHEKDTCTVTADDGIRLTVRDDRGNTGSYTHFAPFKLATPPLNITIGTRYVTCSGKVTGPISEGDAGFEAIVDGSVRVFDKAGGHVYGDSGLDLVEAWAPKVGERVTTNDTTGVDIVQHWNTHFRQANGDIVDGALVVASVPAGVSGGNIGLSNKVGRSFFYMPASTLMPAAEAQPAASLKIEAGRYYKTRDGRKVGPMNHETSGLFADQYVWGAGCNAWNDKGEHLDGLESSEDLIALWQDEPATATTASNDNAKPPKFKVGDRVKTDGGYTFDPNLGEIVEIHDDYVDVRVDSDGYGGSGHWAYQEDDLTPAVAPSTIGFTVPLVDEEDDDGRIVVNLSLDAGNFHNELDEIIAKLKKIRKLQRQVGLAA